MEIKHFEYLVKEITVESTFRGREGQLDELGKEGWELVAIDQPMKNSTNRSYIFKRERDW